MGSNNDFFGPGSNVEKRFVSDHDRLAKIIEGLRQANAHCRIVLTSGSYDLLHVGHSRYLEKAKEQGDFLVVGVDSDEKLQKKKGPHRPIVSEDERIEILAHLRHVDLITLKRSDDGKWNLIKRLRPDVLVLSERTKYSESEIEELKIYCGDVVVFEPQATTSTTARIRRLHIEVIEAVEAKIEETYAVLRGLLAELKGGK